MPAGSGEWLELPVVKWDANFVSNLNLPNKRHN